MRWVMFLGEGRMAVKKHQLMPLELFILFCAKLGLETSYSIQTATGVSVGASSPTLKRLAARGYLLSTAGPRNRQAYRLTRQGEAALRSGIKAGPSVYGRRTARGFYEALPRVLFFSWVKGELDEGRAFLDSVKLSLSAQSRVAKATAEGCVELLKTQEKDDARERKRLSSSNYATAAFKLISSYIESADAEMHVGMLESLAKLMDDLPPSPTMVFSEVPDDTDNDVLVKSSQPGRKIERKKR